MSQKPSLARGTRDYGPREVLRRRYILDTLRQVFELYGYQPIETPAMENRSTLEGKYGEEGERLMFRILNQGDFWKEVPDEVKANAASANLSKHLSDRALRYDLTVPFARYVVMHQHELALPFKRYQMQPVWRGDSPQRGRYREFWQCDVDVVGGSSLLHEAEFVRIYDTALSKLGLQDFTILLNNRKVLEGIAEVAGAPDKLVDICTAIDKLDKVGQEKVEAELAERGLSIANITALRPVFEIKGENEVVLEKLSSWLAGFAAGTQGVAELRQVLAQVGQLGGSTTAAVKVDITLARGLSYYTGCIFEVKSNEVQMGSIGGGGRYDNLTEHFGGKNLTGAGISFGVDRIYDVMEELGIFAQLEQDGKLRSVSSRVLVAHMGANELPYALQVVAQLRGAGIASEVYAEEKKLGKQFEYAEKKGIPYLIIAGSTERDKRSVQLKNITSGEQRELALAALTTTEWF